MYVVFDRATGAQIAELEHPHFVTNNNDRGRWEPAPIEYANGLSIDNTVYQLLGRPPLQEEAGRVFPVVAVKKVDGGRSIYENLQRIRDIESGAMDLADTVDAATSGTDDALMDLGDYIAELTARVEALEAEKKGA